MHVKWWRNWHLGGAAAAATTAAATGAAAIAAVDGLHDKAYPGRPCVVVLGPVWSSWIQKNLKVKQNICLGPFK